MAQILIRLSIMGDEMWVYESTGLDFCEFPRLIVTLKG